MRYMLDTSICIDILRDPNTVYRARFVANAAQICISTVTLHELLHGAERSNRPDYQRSLIENLVSRLVILDFDASAAEHSGQIHGALAKAGNLIGAYDMLIAGHARSLGLIIVTGNMKDFRRVEGLRCEDWKDS